MAAAGECAGFTAPLQGWHVGFEIKGGGGGNQQKHFPFQSHFPVWISAGSVLSSGGKAGKGLVRRLVREDLLERENRCRNSPFFPQFVFSLWIPL